MNSKVQGSLPAGSSKKPGDGVSDEFPAGLRVLIVDDDPICLTILEKMLQTCKYKITQCQRAEIALSKLRENKNGYDIVISDVHMPDMDGFKLLEHIGLEMNLPVIMMSVDDSPNVVMKGVTHGACDYLIKPVRIEAVKNIWQHVYRKKRNGGKDCEQAGSLEDGERQQKPTDEPDYSSSVNEGTWRNSKRRKDDDEEAEDRDDTSALKKPRVVWSVELHQQFVAAVNRLGIDDAVPKKILELMNVPGLTRENVASHLQKYRLYLKRLSGVPQYQNNMNSSFINRLETPLGPLSSLSAIDLQALAATGQLAALQAAGIGRSTVRPSLPISLGDQRNIFSFQNPELTYGEGQWQHSSSSNQMNLLHGVPTAMEPRKLSNLHQSAQSIGSMNMQAAAHGSQSSSLLMQMAHSQPRGQIVNSTNSSHASRVPTSLGQPITSNGASIRSLSRNVIGQSGPGPVYNPISQTSSILTLPMNQTSELPVNNFPLGSTPGPSNLASKGTFQDDVNSGINGSRGFVPSYDIFSELQQNKSNDWALHNVGNAFNTSQQTNPIPGNLDAVQPVFINDVFSSRQSNMPNSDASPVGIEHSHPQGIGHNYNTHLVHNSVRVKTEMVPDPSQTDLGPEFFGQDDLMSALLRQQSSSGQTAKFTRP